MADDLLNLTLEMCGKAEDKNPRFPRLFYDSYVKRIIDTVLDVQDLIWEANGNTIGSERRNEKQMRAAEKCVYLCHLIRVAHDRGYISDKQEERWQRLTSSVMWSVIHWQQSDQKRMGKQ